MRISDWRSDVCSSDLIAEQMGDFGRVMDMPFRIRLQQASCPGDGGAFANAAQHVLKGTLRRAGIERVHGRQQGHARYRRKPLELRQPPRIPPIPPQCRRQPDPARRKMRQSDQQSRSEEHTSELQSLMRLSYAVFCLNKKTN